MFSLLGYLFVGAIIVFFASANAHLVVVNLGLFALQAPLFVVIGVSFFSGFTIAVITAITKTSFGRKKRPVQKEFVIGRSNGRDVEPRIR